MSKRTLAVFAFLVLLAAALIVIPRFLSSPASGTDLKIRVLVNGRQVLEQDLEPGKTIEIRQEDGSLNVVRMTEDGFYMESATCKNQDCVEQGAVTKDNAALRILGNYVICLPNRVEVELVFEDESLAPVMPDASIQVKVGSI